MLHSVDRRHNYGESSRTCKTIKGGNVVRKRIGYLFLALAIVATFILPSAIFGEEAVEHIPLIGENAPAFKAQTTQGMINFPADYKGKWVILFSHPADFTPVCTTEFMTFAKMAPEFKALNCELVGLSIDSNYSHIAWLRTIKEKIKYKGMENVEVNFPVMDIKMDVAKRYGIASAFG